MYKIFVAHNTPSLNKGKRHILPMEKQKPTGRLTMPTPGRLKRKSGKAVFLTKKEEG